MAASDFDLGTGSIATKTDRYVWRIDWTRDKTTKSEQIVAFITETIKQNDPPHKILNKSTYMVTLNDTIANNFRGHNVFLTDLKNMVNECVIEYQSTGSLLDSAGTGSIQELDMGGF